jgi:hypothetical protein
MLNKKWKVRDLNVSIYSDLLFLTCEVQDKSNVPLRFKLEFGCNAW